MVPHNQAKNFGLRIVSNHTKTKFFPCYISKICNIAQQKNQSRFALRKTRTKTLHTEGISFYTIVKVICSFGTAYLKETYAKKRFHGYAASLLFFLLAYGKPCNFLDVYIILHCIDERIK